MDIHQVICQDLHAAPRRRPEKQTEYTCHALSVRLSAVDLIAPSPWRT